MQKKTLQAWLNYLNTLHLRSIDLALGRVQRVAKLLNIQQPACPVVTVAGTNGKGSVVGFLEALYVKAGYNVAAFTSPYLLSFNEQFRINQQWIDDEKLCDYFEKIDAVRGDITLTLFEFKTLAALLFFLENALDVWILEVGLGGRLDAVNIIDPDVAVITSISLDHCDWLGDTRELIGREKAGILRAGKYAVCGDLNPLATIQEVADEVGAKGFYRNKDFFVTEEKDSWAWRGPNVVLENLPEPQLLKDNIATALMVVECLSAITSQDLLRSIIATVSVPGRLQIISNNPFIVIDVSHNEDSVRRLAVFLEQHQKKNVTAVFSVLKTKDCAAMVRVISPYIAKWHIAECDSPSAMPLAQIEAILHDQHISVVLTHDSIVEAFAAAKQSSSQAIAVFGSFYVISEILHEIS